MQEQPQNFDTLAPEERKLQNEQEHPIQNSKSQFMINSPDDTEEKKVETISKTHKTYSLREENETTGSKVQIVFVGNVDCGRSTICQDLMISTGAIDKERLTDLKKEFPYSNKEWVRCLLSQSPKEQIDIRLKTPNKEFKIFNNFIGSAARNHNYLYKTSLQFDAICLVVSAALGEFEAGFDRHGWTKQCLKVATVSGVSKLIIIVNKMDHQTVLWSQARYQEIKDEITKFLKKLGFDLQNIDWIPVSGLSKENITACITHPSGSWYKGPPLLKLLDQLSVASGDPSGPTRVLVSDKFEEKGQINLIGEIQNGTLKQNTEMHLIPNLQRVLIKEIFVDFNELSSPLAKPGEIVKITIETKEQDNIKILKEKTLALSSDMPPVCSEIECEITILDLPKSKSILTSGSEFVIYLHNVIQEAWITSIQEELDEKNENTSKKINFLKPWSKGIVHIALKNGDPIYCEKYSLLPKLGKFFLQDEDMFIAYGKILRIKPIKNENPIQQY